MKKLLSTILAIAMVFSLSTTAFAATSVSDFTDSDYLTMKPLDYHKMRTFSTNGKGVAWDSGATVIYGESGLFGTIPGAKGDGIWQKSPSVDTSVKSISFPTSVVILGIQTLDGRDAVTSINFNELTNLKYIGISAFNRTKITTADLSKTKVINIDDGAFMAGTQATLTTFTAPSTLKRLGTDVFANQTRVTLNLNEGLEIIDDGALKDAPGTTIPSTVNEIGKNALNPNTTYKVTKGSYAEQYCKDNSIKYVYTDNTSPTTPTDPTTPATNFPTMEYTKQIGPVTFSNYVSHTQSNPSDANGNKIDVTWVKISDKGSMRADKDKTEFKYHYSEPWNTTNELDVGRTDNTFGSGHWSLSQRGVTPYATTKSNGTWSKGLTWQFNYNAQYTNQNSFKITVENNNQKYYYYVTVVTDKPSGSTTTPTNPTTPATKATANPTNSKVMVNGKQVSFDAYNINNNNYFKLRDVAQIIRGTDKQFNVTWDGTKNAINLISNEAYESTGGELALGDGQSKQSTLSTSTIYKDGVEVSLTAYNINGNNYFKLRDLGQVFNFEVSWDGANNTVVINTANDYTE
ncbi:leucine-rich repeat protein [Sedimentibacter hydroxybenzoicus DSM 7310]|uniref:Leucine-rich repeat protein n=1 Tax=Sedimentibacter hydroxybenzoicus DSM 7310 TaxID=1123245 RepID=A0A974BID5_SEDHY|nr:leucine-rich repeat protein [Sedimentibacter hydroxybenzoicus]NYB73769.1 leucine-rich repeat protein [Sedimentibacter hydroxybenzoicus DSM 7310]